MIINFSYTIIHGLLLEFHLRLVANVVRELRKLKKVGDCSQVLVVVGHVDDGVLHDIFCFLSISSRTRTKVTAKMSALCCVYMKVCIQIRDVSKRRHFSF